MKLCVIGDPVAHSQSPALHTALLARAGIRGTYERVRVTPEELPRFMAAARRGAWDGFNVTMPLKECILPLLDELEETAAAMGAVNTVVIREGRAKGFTTDGPGFLRTLPALPQRALVLGNGGAARAVGHALRGAGVRVDTCCRHPQAGMWAWEQLPDIAARCELLVNATPLGMAGKGEFADFRFLERLAREATVYDLVYAPADTALLRQAAALGHPVIGGLALLQAQAELAFGHFTRGLLPAEEK